jgi:hypothetical protein
VRVEGRVIIRRSHAPYVPIDNFYNVERRHSYLGNISPTEFETLWISTNPVPQLA